MTAAILVLNAGSSSLKFALYEPGELALLCRGTIAAIGGETDLKVTGPEQALLGGQRPPAHANHEAATSWLLGLVGEIRDLHLVAVGHRVVHGGSRFSSPTVINATVLAEFRDLIPLAPGHQPHNLAAVDAVARAWPGLPQVACFDTAFHRTMPRLAQLYPLPRDLVDGGMVRYGFHGLSYEYIADVLPDHAGERANGRVVVAHLGHGASLCGMRNRRSIATSMGFTALDGIMMGTRSGAIDPGIILHLIQARGMATDEVADLLYARSGLLGVSGISDDVRILEASDDPRAAEALDLFAYRVVREIGSLVAALGGLDVLVFTAGVGEHSAGLRDRIAQGLAWTGLTLDHGCNARSEVRISDAPSKVDAFVIPANEELPIARAARDLA
ncbi:acetate/propionate family kinase [Microvirga guangxiensis]|uniref:Acetate kinase n=1 Tax=Microvirga guangxiensis TaxID=549386 RepID=A0A1G5KBC0_9HYPH|nr:acetate/propionate family kinase [Microvirga guangxiensis]SCY97915.1 acetate kinase [Microvirga guangxiensis]